MIIQANGQKPKLRNMEKDTDKRLSEIKEIYNLDAGFEQCGVITTDNLSAWKSSFYSYCKRRRLDGDDVRKFIFERQKQTKGELKIWRVM